MHMQKPNTSQLRSPDQIDRLLHIIHVPLWISLFVVMGIVAGVLIWAFLARLPILVSGRGVLFDPASIYVIQTNLTGNIREILINADDPVEIGSPLFILDNPARQLELQEVERQIAFVESKGAVPTEELLALQMQRATLQEYMQALTLRSPVKGVVLSMDAARGELVQPNHTLAWLHETTAAGEKIEFYSFFPAEVGALIQPGMQAHIAFKSVDPQRYGKMVGVVRQVVAFTGAQIGDFSESFPSEEWRAMLSGNKAIYTVIVDPVMDPATASGYQWTSSIGPPFKIPLNAFVDVTVLLKKTRPINYLIPVDP